MGDPYIYCDNACCALDNRPIISMERIKNALKTMTKSLFVLITCTIIFFNGCVSKNNRSNIPAAKTALENFDGCRIEVEGIYFEYAEPALEVTSHTVGNARHIVRLKLNISLVQNLKNHNVRFGGKVIVIGTVKAKNMKIPEIIVEDIHGIQ